MNTIDKKSLSIYFFNQLYRKYKHITGLNDIKTLTFYSKMLLFGVIAHKEGLNIFDKWIMLPSGPSEEDSLKYIREYSLEKNIPSGRSIIYMNTVPEELADIVDRMVNSIPDSIFFAKDYEIFEKSRRYLKNVNVKLEELDNDYIKELNIILAIM